MGKYNKTSIGESYTAEHRRKRNWKKVVAVLSCFVIVGTVSALTLPAITMNQPACDLEEHQHSEACHGEVSVLACNAEVHQHTEDCRDAEGNLICHYADFQIHEHDGACYDAQGSLICSLPEAKEHQHDDGCYQAGEETVVDAGHRHSDQCYSWTISEIPTCGLEVSEGHTHDETCRSVVNVLTCTEAEEAGHTHDESCSDAEGNLICELEEKSDHQHGDSCYTEQETLTCEQEESTGHQHDDACFRVRDDLNCTKQERYPVTEPGEPVLICEKPEITAHTHEKSVCYNGNDTNPNQWHCDALEVKAHRHTDECFTTEQTITCGKTEHTHDDSCKPEAALTEEEQLQVDDVISIIDGLPPVAEIEAESDRLAENAEELAAYRAKVLGAVRTAFDEYNALTETQKAAVTNGEKLEDYRYLLEDQKVTELIAAIDDLPSVEEMEAELARLADDPEALAAYQEQLTTSVEEILTSLDTLPEAQKADVSNIDQLENCLAWMNGHNFGHEKVYTVKQYTDGSYTQVLEASSVAVALKGKLPIGSVVRSYPVEFSMGEDGPVLFAQDITIFLADGSVYQPQEAVTVGVSGLEIPSHQELDVFHDLEDEYGGMERMAYTIDGSTVTFQTSSFSTYAIVDAYQLNRIAEPANGSGIIDSGWINYWSDKLNNEPVLFSASDAALLAVDGGNGKPSDEQVTNRGGSKTDGTVTVSKTIQGTDVENVFDITLTVDTTTNITEVMKDPDMAVVIVMDISNTMKSSFGGSTRYQAAVESAEAFIDKFAASNNGYSKIGFVAFNTDAHEVFNISSCSTTVEATNLKNQIRQKTGAIVNHENYGVNTTPQGLKRFTNIEGGLKRANDMLSKATNQNKYIIFLSDGFPTTYCQPGSYVGYSTYCTSGAPGTNGVFYDQVGTNASGTKGSYCQYGTSYSDEAAIRARNAANSIKASGATIFSIGVDVGGQTITGYDTNRGNNFSVIDRTSETYEIGSANDENAFKNWLGNSIGSGYYYDSTNTAGLQAAYNDIFKKIQSSTEQANNLKWIASDPMPMGMQNNEVTMEFIGFFDKNNALQVCPPQTGLTGSGTAGAENTVSFDGGKSAIAWDIKNSGYTATGSGNSTTYHYTVTYRVRLKNELAGFVENQSYDTNGKTTLTYQEVIVVDGKETVSGDKTIEFPIPAVKGYLGELKFKKVDQSGGALQDAVFELSHDDSNCGVCRGDNAVIVTAMKGKVYTVSSGTDGMVVFQNLPSGHAYTLKETKAPAGYQLSNATYAVKIAYDVVTVQETGTNTTPWDLSNGKVPTIVNYAGAILPATGGSGTSLYIFNGLLLMGAAALIYSYRCKKRKEAK